MEMRIVKMDKIGYMGIPGSFSEVAANELLADRNSTRLNSSHIEESRMPSSA